jgi:predicted nuclease of restriction endonuclease-like (RecB) superfamily
VSGKLSWSHYCELLSISDENKRSFYEKETVNSRWSVRELKRQISTSLYERLLLSDGKTNKKTVLSLAQHGIKMSNPADIIKDPFVFRTVLSRVFRILKPVHKKFTFWAF